MPLLSSDFAANPLESMCDFNIMGKQLDAGIFGSAFYVDFPPSLSRPGREPSGNIGGAFDLSLPTMADHRWIQMSPLRSAQTKAIIQLLLIIISHFPMSAISQRQTF